MLAGGACAGLAGVNEVAGPLGQLQPSISPGYGFAAIIVAFVGRLHPVGILLASLLMSLLYLGGESAQIGLALPSAVTGLFQGLLLFFLLAADVFIHFRLRWRTPLPVARIGPFGSLRRSRPPDARCGHSARLRCAGRARDGKSRRAQPGCGRHDAGRRSERLHRRRDHRLAVARGHRGRRAGAALALVFGVLTLTLLANQVASGLALSLFGVGLSAFIGRPYVSVVIHAIPPLHVPVLSDLPIAGKLIFGSNPLVYLSLALFALVQWFMVRTRAGLVLRAVGESPAAAHAIGHPVVAIRYAAVAFGGACAGVAGAYLAVAYTPLWMEGMTAGRGWIALALVVFATWRPWRVLAGAYLFGGVTLAQFQAQASGTAVPSQLLSMLPYLATIAVLAFTSRDIVTIRLNAPASLGKPFHPDARLTGIPCGHGAEVTTAERRHRSRNMDRGGRCR